MVEKVSEVGSKFKTKQSGRESVGGKGSGAGGKATRSATIQRGKALLEQQIPRGFPWSTKRRI